MNKFIDFLHKIEPEFLQGIAYAEKITSAILAWLHSPQGKTIEQVLEGIIPASAPWADEVISVATMLAADMKVLSNPISWYGIALRLGAEIFSIIHGKKLTIGEYIARFQNVFIG